MAKKTVERMVDKVSRLYEQNADLERIETYLLHWLQWVRSGVDGVSLFGFGLVLSFALTQQTTEAYPFGRVGWANCESLAIRSVILSICPPYKSDRTSHPTHWYLNSFITPTPTPYPILPFPLLPSYSKLLYIFLHCHSLAVFPCRILF
ncbi:MAG: hypothetical protein F6J98_48150 [Moorea sp. SIO4G2]|nr:hypothetical protein [Moorena sp. SIO4G2]